MDNRVMQVPVSLLLDPGPSASAKVVWMARRLRPAAGPAELETLTALSRNTVVGATAAVMRSPAGPRVKVPGALLAERTVGAQAKVLYGLLQAVPGFRNEEGRFTYTALCTQTMLGRNTLKRAIRELVDAGWVQTKQKNQLSPIRFTLVTPEQTRGLAEAAGARLRLNRAEFGGEALMMEYLSLLIESDQFTDNARPGFLVNPLTGERLELDRFYPPHFAFEFNGAQHYRRTGRFSQAQAEAQHLRDLIKAGICLYQGIQLVIIHPEDLSLRGMSRKIPQGMPLRDLAGHGQLIDLLEDESLTYCGAAVTRSP